MKPYFDRFDVCEAYKHACSEARLHGPSVPSEGSG